MSLELGSPSSSGRGNKTHGVPRHLGQGPVRAGPAVVRAPRLRRCSEGVRAVEGTRTWTHSRAGPERRGKETLVVKRPLYKSTNDTTTHFRLQLLKSLPCFLSRHKDIGRRLLCSAGTVHDRLTVAPFPSPETVGQDG